MDGSVVRVLKANGKIHPLDRYLQEPAQEIDIPEENILKPPIYFELEAVTGFTRGPQFKSAGEVREFFNTLVDRMGKEVFIDRGGEGDEPIDLTPSREMLNYWTNLVIANRWHCEEEFRLDG